MSDKKKKKKELIRAHTQAEALKDAKEFLEHEGGPPRTRLRESPKQTKISSPKDLGAPLEEHETKKRKKVITNKLVRAHTQAEALKDAQSFLDKSGGAPRTRLRENPKQTKFSTPDDLATPMDTSSPKKTNTKKRKANTAAAKKKKATTTAKKKKATAAKKKKARSPSPKRYVHPTYLEMISEAISHYKKRGGSSYVAICRYLEEKFDLPDDFQIYVKTNLKKGVEKNLFELNKRSYKLTAKNKRQRARSASPSRGSRVAKSNTTDKKKTGAASPKKKKTRAASPKKKNTTAKKKTASPKPKRRKVKKKGAAVRALKRVPSTVVVSGPTLGPQSLTGGNLEIIFSFDTTGSMYSYLDEVRNKLTEIVSDLLEDIPGIRIGIIAHGDYCDEKTSYLLKKQDFCSDAKVLSKWIKTVGRTGGGDAPEAYELVLQEAQKFSWTDDNYTRVLVVIGDATPHKKTEYRKIDWREELKNLVNMDVRVYGVQAGSGAEATKFYEALAEESYGSHLKLDEINQIKEMMMGLCYREAAEMHYQHHANEINTLERKDSAQLMLPEEVKNEKERLTDEQILKIHNAIHDPEQTDVEIKGNKHKIAVGKAGCRFVRIEGLTFIEQNKEKDSKYARMALEGKDITWIVRKGKWGLIVDGDIKNK